MILVVLGMVVLHSLLCIDAYKEKRYKSAITHAFFFGLGLGFLIFYKLK